MASLVLAILALCVPAISQAASQLQFTVSGDDNIWVFADGQAVGTHSGWMDTSVFNLPYGTYVVAVQIQNIGGLAGLIGDINDPNTGTAIITDGSWKCSGAYTAGWANWDFDDNNWPWAVASRSMNDPDMRFNRPQINPNAKWIWAGDYNAITTVYCRKYLSGLQFTVSGDDEVSVFADGRYLGNHKGWTTTTVFNIKQSTSTIAIHMIDIGGLGGVIGSINNGIVTDSQWKCTRAYFGTWFNTDFDDSSWPQAVATRGQGEPDPRFYRSDINSSAKWIWAGDYNWSGGNVHVYCRRTHVTSLCDSKPCLNGGVCKVSGTTFTCTCAAGYTGTTCSTKVSDPCASTPCKNGGVCRANGAAYTCTCPSAYTGATCTTPTACASSPCQHGGTCVPNGLSDYDCNCVSDYDDGDTCTTYQDPCTSAPCLHGGVCTRTSSLTFTCSCSTTYGGAYCEVPKGKDPCAANICQHGGTCKTISVSAGTYTCTCTKNYEGIMCEKIICISNPTTECDLVGTAYGKYSYCGDCGSWSVCRARKRKVRSCLSRAPNVYFSRATRNCTATVTSCKGLPGY